MPTTTAVSVDQIIDQLIEYNQSTLNRVIGLMEKLESDLINLDGTSVLQGEGEELLRVILEGAIKIVETLLSLHEELQSSIVESYFPAQD